MLKIVSNIVFTGMFSAQKRAYIKLVGKTGMHTAKEVAEEYRMSLPSVFRIWNEKFKKDFERKRKTKDMETGLRH
jgi:hypothetical protein